MDQLSTLLPRFGFQATTFFTGEFCGETQFRGDDAVGHLHLIRRGPVFFEHDDLPHLDIVAPSLVFYPMPCPHRLIVPPTSVADLVCATIAFKEAHRNPLAKSLPTVMQIPLAQANDLEPTLRLLFSEASKNESGKQLVMDRLCDILIVQVMRHALRTGHTSNGIMAGLSDPAIAVALAAIHANPSYPWRLDGLAELACMSRSKFAGYFRDVVGLTPGGYLLEWRMGLAERLLSERQAVKAVALAVGYSNQPAFTKAFTARAGVSPTQWLRQAQSG